MMRVFSALLVLLCVEPLHAKFLFRATDFVTSTLPGRLPNPSVWSVEEIDQNLVVIYEGSTGRFKTTLTDDGAIELKKRLTTLELTQQDVDFLRKQQLSSRRNDPALEKPLQLGYVFELYDVKGRVREVTSDNPESDLKYHPTLEQAKRLEAVLQVVHDLMFIAAKTKVKISTVAEGLERASGVYLCVMRMVDAKPKLFVTSVWLHRTKTAAPQIGQELPRVRPPQNLSWVARPLVVFDYDPSYSGPGPGVANRVLPVLDDKVDQLNLPLEDVEKEVRAAQK